jgi:ribokinase
MTQFDAMGFGALNVDKLFKVNRIALAEEESFVTNYLETCGGSAANTIVGLSRLQCKTGFIGKIGSDREGELLLENFHKEHVDTEGIVRSEKGRSGTVIGFIDAKGERALYVDSGINDTITWDQKNVEYADQAKFLHLTSFVGEKPFKVQRKLLGLLSDNVRISLDPGEIYARKGLNALEPFLRRAYVVMPNARELSLLLGSPDYKRNADILLKHGVKIVAVKLGREGCYVTDGKERFHIDSFRVKVADTTGAGDAFCAGFLYGLINGEGLQDCGKIGNFVASKCVMKVGARSGLPELADLEGVDIL